MSAPSIPGGYRKVPNRLADSTASDGAVRLYLRLQFHAAKKGGTAFASRQTLAKELKVSMKSVDRRLAELVRGGWITPTSRKATYKGVISYKVNTAPEESERLRRRVNSGQFSSAQQPGRVDSGDGTSGPGRVDSGVPDPLCVTGDGEVITKNDTPAPEKPPAVCRVCNDERLLPGTDTACSCWTTSAVQAKRGAA